MKHIIGIGLLCSWISIGNLTATATTNTEAISAVFTNETPPHQTVPDDLYANILTRFSFDVNAQPDLPVAFIIPATFQRDSTAIVKEKEVQINEPRLVAGKFGKGILLEESHANLFSQNQADVEGDMTNIFIAQKDTLLSLTTNAYWQGQQSLEVETSGEAGEEGVALEVTVNTAQYNGQAIVPAYYVASVYLKNAANLMLSLKPIDHATFTEPIYIEPGAKLWERFSCTYVYPFPSKEIGPHHEDDWEEKIPTNTPITVKLKFQCVTADKHETLFFADGFQIEERQLPFAGQSAGLSPLSWIPGKTTLAQDEFSFPIQDDFFTSWKQSGTISFWFKSNWDIRDGSQELMLYMGPHALYLWHMHAQIKFHPAGVDFTPYDWRDHWHHIAITWNKKGKRVLYLDGYNYANTQGELKPLPSNMDILTLSYRTKGTSPNGIIDELLLFKQVLNIEQIKSIAAYVPPKPPKPAVKEASSSSRSSTVKPVSAKQQPTKKKRSFP